MRCHHAANRMAFAKEAKSTITRVQKATIAVDLRAGALGRANYTTTHDVTEHGVNDDGCRISEGRVMPSCLNSREPKSFSNRIGRRVRVENNGEFHVLGHFPCCLRESHLWSGDNA
jgi:hypothetical protein